MLLHAAALVVCTAVVLMHVLMLLLLLPLQLQTKLMGDVSISLLHIATDDRCVN